MAEEDFVNVEPTNTGAREVKLSPEDIQIIKENPRGLTKEGCMVKVWYWLQSNNYPMQIRYLAMYKMCKNWAKSGTLEDGSVILARCKHTHKSGITKELIFKEKIGQKNKKGEWIIAESMDVLKQLVESKLHNLRFITTKGG